MELAPIVDEGVSEANERVGWGVWLSAVAVAVAVRSTAARVSGTLCPTRELRLAVLRDGSLDLGLAFRLRVAPGPLSIHIRKENLNVFEDALLDWNSDIEIWNSNIVDFKSNSYESFRYILKSKGEKKIRETNAFIYFVHASP